MLLLTCGSYAFAVVIVHIMQSFLEKEILNHM